MKKKLISLILAAAMICMLVPNIVFAETTASGTCGADGDNITWELADGVLTITGTGEMENFGWSGAPWYSYRDSITSAVIDEGVTNIGKYAFQYCSGLMSVEIPNGVESIGNYAFYECSSLTSVEVPDSVTDIGWDAFAGCGSLTSVEIPDSVVDIGEYAFADCSSLTSVTIGSGITYICSDMFDYCTALENFIVSDENSVYSTIDGVLFDKDMTTLILYPIGKTGTYEIPTGIISVGDYAFLNCEGLTSVTIPDSVTEVEVGAFQWCTGLESVTLSNSMTSINIYSFYGCTNLASIKLPDNITSIEDSAFEDCESLAEVELNDNLKSIGEDAFNNCTSLAEIELNDNLKSIGVTAFHYCTSLTSITIPQNTAIMGYAFDTDVVIYGYSGSVAEIYANKNGNEFVSVGEVSDEIEEIYVTTADELEDAIGSNRKITLADGVYILSGYNSLEISAVNLSIVAENSGKAEVLVRWTDIPVVNIIYSYNLNFQGVIFGHYKLPGDPECPDNGYVIYAIYSEDITLVDCDLFGCGISNVYLNDVSGFAAENCVMRDCRDNIGYFYNSDASFSNCVMSANAYDDEWRERYDAVEYSNTSGDEENTVVFTDCTFINNYNTALYDEQYSDYIIFDNCIFKNNAWDGETPQENGVCLNGITWQIKDSILYLGYDLEYDDGTIIESETGVVLPYSSSSKPWQQYTYETIDTAEGVTVDYTPRILEAYTYLSRLETEDENGNIAYRYVTGISAEVDNYTSGTFFTAGYSGGVEVGFGEMSVYESGDGTAYIDGTIDANDADTVKIFCWDSLDGMVPLSNAFTVTTRYEF